VEAEAVQHGWAPFSGHWKKKKRSAARDQKENRYSGARYGNVRLYLRDHGYS